ncbi:hypothetical protein AM305_07944, partial [Actinobacillus minor NM305]
EWSGGGIKPGIEIEDGEVALGAGESDEGAEWP